MGNPIEFTGNYAVDWPDKFRAEIEGYAIIVLNGDKGWMQTMGETKEMDAEQLAEQKETNYAGYVATLLPLKDKAYTLTSLGEVKVGDRPALGVKVSSKGHRDVELYFDKDTNLLIKSQTRVKSREQEGKEMDQESLYADYKEVDGAKVPMKVTINREGKVYVESENSDLKPADSSTTARSVNRRISCGERGQTFRSPRPFAERRSRLGGCGRSISCLRAVSAAFLPALLQAPRAQRLDHRPERLSDRGQTIIDPRRHLRVNGSLHNAVALQLAQVLGEYFLGDALHAPMQLGETFYALKQAIQDGCLPAAADYGERNFGRAFRDLLRHQPLPAQKKVSGTFRRSSSTILLRLESSRHLFLG
jgi:hypothetical protein